MSKKEDISKEEVLQKLKDSRDWNAESVKNDLGTNELNLLFAILAESFDCKEKIGTVSFGAFRLLSAFDITLKTKKIEDL